MPAEPTIKPLPYKHRTWIFRLFFLVFLLALPAIIFYATGYRFEFTRNSTSIISTGGMYISVPAEEASIYLDEELVRDIRVFRRASYIQNLDVGQHRLHVQGEGLYTWVKELPVYPHIVTEVQAFNMPLVPQIRLIAPYQSFSGEGVYVDRSTSTLAADFENASSTVVVTASSTMATTTLLANQEYEYVESLFGTTTEDGTLVDKMVQGVNEAFTFSPATSTIATSTELATTTLTVRNMKLYESGGELYATWVGRDTEIPYYFCIDHEAASTTRLTYGEHVLKNVQALLASMPETETQQVTKRICRDKIRLDRLYQEVKMFTFMPGTTDLVLLQLQDGLHAVEIDDRAWQNTQLLYPGDDIDVVVDNDRIYIKDRGYYLEVFTELPARR